MDARPQTIDRIERIHVLLNPAAGSSPADRLDEIQSLFDAAGMVAEIETVPAAALTARLQELQGSGVAAVAVGGGDGTISSAANTLAGSGVLLIPLPLGTLNHFANRFGLGNLDAVRDALRAGTMSMIAVGEVNGRVFINNASCGFYPHVVRHRDRLKRLLTKWPAAALATLMVYFKRPLMEVALHTEQTRIHRTTAAVWIGLGRNSLRLPVPGEADTEGDLLEVVMPRPHSRLKLAWLALRVWLRLRRQQKPVYDQVEVLRTSEFTLASRRPIDLALDGEPSRLPGPLEFRFRPDALLVLSNAVDTPHL